MNSLPDLEKLSDSDLIEQTRDEVRGESLLGLRVVACFREIKGRFLWAQNGCPDFKTYCIETFGLSDQAVRRRTDAMDLLDVFPEFEERLRSGELTMSILAQAQNFFRQEALAGFEVPFDLKREITGKLRGLSTRQADRLFLSHSKRPAPTLTEGCRAVSENLSMVRFFADDPLLGDLDQILGFLAPTEGPLGWGKLIASMARITLDLLDPARRPVHRKARPGTSKHPSEGAVAPTRDSRATSEVNAGVFADVSPSTGNLSAEASIPAQKVDAVSLSQSVASETSSRTESSSPATGSPAPESGLSFEIQPNETEMTPSALTSAVQSGVTGSAPSTENLSTEVFSPAQDACLEVPGDQSLRVFLAAAEAYLSTNSGGSGKHYYPVEFVRELFIRDQSCCAWVDPVSGRRCRSKYRLQVDHIIPRAWGGKTTLSNCRIACFGHNQRHAVNLFGLKKMKKHWGRQKPKRE